VTSDRFGDMFEGDFVETCAFMLMGGGG
jgi:hypothetical protein